MAFAVEVARLKLQLYDTGSLKFATIKRILCQVCFAPCIVFAMQNNGEKMHNFLFQLMNLQHWKFMDNSQLNFLKPV